MTLTILDIERARQNFYAPAFSLEVSDRNLVRDLKLEVVSVQVEMVLAGADRFTFVVNNGFDIARREFIKVAGKTLPEFFELGAQVEIRMGYGDRKHLEVMLMGIVTELSTSFPSSGLPQVTVSGYDHSYRLTKGVGSRNWGEQKRDCDVVREIARLYNLNGKVEVHGWNIQTKEPIVGRAGKGDEPGRDAARPSGKTRASGAEYLGKVCKAGEGTLRVREPVFSQQEADDRARAILKRHSEGFVGGRGESIGIPEIRPDANVTLKGLGDMFNTTFYVSQATHTVDGSGYHTSFDVKDTTI